VNLVDSSAWLAYFADEPEADFFAEAIEDTDLLVVPSVCIYEVSQVVLRERGEDAAFSAVAAMHQGTLVDLDAGLAMEAAALGLEEGLAFADSVIYAQRSIQSKITESLRRASRIVLHRCFSGRESDAANLYRSGRIASAYCGKRWSAGCSSCAVLSGLP
jgi:toxin FitB